MARRDDRADWESVREEQRRQSGCPAREICDESRFRGTSLVVRRLIPAVLLAAAAAFAYDAARPPGLQVSARLAVSGIHAYQSRLAARAGPWTGACRFTPTCSRYAETVIARDGIVKGGWLAVRRIARCGPWTAAGTHDPP